MLLNILLELHWLKHCLKLPFLSLLAYSRAPRARERSPIAENLSIWENLLIKWSYTDRPPTKKGKTEIKNQAGFFCMCGSQQVYLTNLVAGKPAFLRYFGAKQNFFV